MGVRGNKMDENLTLERFVSRAFDSINAQSHSDPADTATADFFTVTDDLNIIKAVIIYTFLVYRNNNVGTDRIDEYINRVVLSSTKSEVVGITVDFMCNITV